MAVQGAALLLALALTADPGAASRAAAAGGLPELSRVVKDVMPGVVGVVTMQDADDLPPGHGELRGLFDHFHASTPKKGLGTGFVIDRSGYLLTNAHVIEGSSRVEVVLGDDDVQIPARVVGRDEASDIALLKIDPPSPLTVLPLGDSERVAVAEWVLVLGNPFGLSHTVTLGIVSHTGRSDIAPAGRDGFYDFIQTDASINPGNSGGPLVNTRGEVIGIATAINATGQGIGFAIPINMAKEILGQLKEHGRVMRSWMGITVREVPPGLGARTLPRGVIITEVTKGGPAAQGGLEPGDVITGFDGRQVRNASRLRWYVSTAGIGRSVGLTVRRGARERLVQVELGPTPDERVAEPAPPIPGASPEFPDSPQPAGGGD
jgi:serine protease Do